MRISDWSSDVCSSDLAEYVLQIAIAAGGIAIRCEDQVGSGGEGFTITRLDAPALLLLVIFYTGAGKYRVQTEGADRGRQHAAREKDRKSVGRESVCQYV